MGRAWKNHFVKKAAEKRGISMPQLRQRVVAYYKKHPNVKQVSEHFEVSRCFVGTSLKKFGIPISGRLQVLAVKRERALARMKKTGRKPCTRCKKIKPLSAFHVCKGNRDGLTVHCLTCVSAYHRERTRKLREENPSAYLLKIESDRKYYRNNAERARDVNFRRMYGITLADYNVLSERQGHVCACCGRSAKQNRHKRLYVDHDHATGEVRGLLCTNCNRNLGVLENEKFVSSAKRYLADPPARKILKNRTA
jgi:hypothetical protein